MAPVLLLAAAVAAAAGSAPAAHAAGGRSSQVRCDIAWAYIERLLREPGRGPSVFSTEAFDPFVPDGLPRSWEAVDGARPPPDGLTEALPRRSNAVRSCPSIQRSLTGRGLRFGGRAVASASHVPGGRHYRARIELVSLPAVSADGAHAIIVESNSRGGTDAGEVWVHMARGRDGGWHVAGYSSLFVS